MTLQTGIRLAPINEGNIDIVATLLSERNGTIPEYVAWKYGKGSPDGPKGTIAYNYGEPAGCFGMIPRILLTSGGSQLNCGWFADWYVKPAFRASGIGSHLLESITELAPIVFGHPSPAPARALCLKLGYSPLPFQSRRRLVLEPLTYSLSKTKYRFKGLIYAAYNQLKSTSTQLTNKFSLTAWMQESGGNHSTAHSCFDNASVFGRWIENQPVGTNVCREFGSFGYGEKCIHFMDVRKGAGIKYRHVMYHGSGLIKSDWNDFCSATQKAECIYLEVFTSTRSIDSLLAGIGFVRIHEAPVLVHNQKSLDLNMSLFGWDRENWSYLAS